MAIMFPENQVFFAAESEREMYMRLMSELYNIIGETEFNHLASTIDLQGVLDKVSLCFPKRYDAIIVDEAQDFHEEWALTIRALLKDDQESLLYVFYDEEQNIFQRDFGEAFLINSPPFLLRRNLRNTENIWAFVVAETSLGSFSYSNGIAGVDPKGYPTKNRNKLFESITHQIRALTAEGVAPHSIVILSDRKLINTPLSGFEEIAGFHFVDGSTVQQSEILEAIRFYTYEVSSRLSDLKIHSIIDKLNPNLRAVESFNGKQRVREFYAMSPEDAYSILEAIAEIHGCVDKLKRMVPSEEEQVAEREAQEIDSESTERATNFSFSACQIPLGAKIEFGENPNITATVVGDRSVEYNGETMSLTALAKLLTGKQYSIAGPRFFKYKGEWLNDIRHRIGV